MDQIDEIIKKARSLPKAKESKNLIEFECLAFPELTDCFLSRDRLGNLIFAIGLADSPEDTAPPELILEHFDILPTLSCFIGVDQRRQKRNVLRIAFKTLDHSLVSLFFRVVSAILTELPASRSRMQVQAQLNKMMELFRSLARPPRETMHGLWGELFVISKAKNTDSAIRSWRSETHEVFDFIVGDVALEAKCSLKGMRKHRFSYEQLVRSSKIKVIHVASIVTEEAENGISLRELCDVIRKRIKSKDLVTKFELVLHRTLGRNWKRIDDFKLSEERAERSLRVIDSKLIPTIPGPIPQGVTSIHFDSNLELLALPGDSSSAAEGLNDIFRR